MMKAVIIEDETAAAVNLGSLLLSTFPGIEIMATLESVAESVEWFNRGNKPDIVFMDIHLADGNAFLIFDRVNVEFPVIFTTAYDQYALEAFKVNSIDYILKPIKSADLERAVSKLSKLSGADIARQMDRIADATKRYNNFLLYVKDKIVPLRHEDIAFCYTFNERVTIHTIDGREIPYDKSLDVIMDNLSGDEFYRINRQFIVSRKAVKEISIWPGSRLCVTTCVPSPEKIIVSKVRTPHFKRWIVKN